MARDDKPPRTLNDLLKERHARGAAVLGGRIVPSEDGSELVYLRHEPPPQRRWSDGRQVQPANPSIFDRPGPEAPDGESA